MFIFIPRKKIVVDAFTCNTAAYRYFPVDTANNYIPEWFKNTPKEIPDKQVSEKGPKIKLNTIRRCAGILDYYSKNSLVIPLWSDLRLEVSNDGYKYEFADRKSSIVHHQQDMRGPLLLPEYEHLKILSPWRFEEKSGVNWHVSTPFYNNIDIYNDIIIPPGILNFKYQMSTEINFFTKRPAIGTKTIDLNAGRPMFIMYPNSDKEVEIRTHILTNEEYSHRNSWLFAFNNTYQKAKKIQQKQGDKHKCPFSFKYDK